MSLKRTLAIIVSAMMILSLVACGTTSTNETTKSSTTASPGSTTAAPAETTTATASGEKVDIRITTRWSGEEPLSVWFRQQCDEFSAADNGINIVQDNIANEDSYLDKLRTQIATGDQPEIFIEYGGSRIIDYVEGGILLDVAPYLEADPEWSGNILNLYDKWQFEGVEGTYGIPCQFYTVLLYYNKAILDQYDIAVPETFEEFEAACDKLVSNGQVALKIGEKENWRAGHFFNNLIIKTLGTQGVKDLGNRTLSYDDPKMIEMYATIKRFSDNGYFGPNAVGVDTNAETTAFINGESAFAYNGTWVIPEYSVSTHAADFGVTAFPSIDPKYASYFQGGAADGYSISKRDDATNEASMKVVKFLTSADYFKGLEKLANGGVYPVMFDSDPDATIDPLTTAAKAIIATGTEFRDDVQTYDQASHMLDTVRTALQGLFIGNSPEQCGKEILTKIKSNE